MRWPLLTILPALLLFTPALFAQPDTPAAPVPIYTSGANVTAPQLLPSTMPRAYSELGCRSDEDGTATFALIVDAAGQPRNIYFLNPIGDDLDLIALKEVLSDRFTPGKRAGQPVAVAASVDVKLHSCLAERKDEHGKSQNLLQLTSAPEQELKPAVDAPQQAVLVSGSGLAPNSEAGIDNVGGEVAAPVRFHPSPGQMQEARLLLRDGQYKVSIVVDRYGLPERLRIVDAEMPHMEQQVAAVFRLCRWKPAMKNGVPIPVRIETGLDQDASMQGGGRRR